MTGWMVAFFVLLMCFAVQSATVRSAQKLNAEMLDYMKTMAALIRKFRGDQPLPGDDDRIRNEANEARKQQKR